MIWEKKLWKKKIEIKGKKTPIRKIIIDQIN
jgi:hypothetical protein